LSSGPRIPFALPTRARDPARVGPPVTPSGASAPPPSHGASPASPGARPSPVCGVASPAERPVTPPDTAAEHPSTLTAIGSVMGASVVGRLLRFVKVLAVARLLSPGSYGVFVALTVLINYAQFLELGSSTAAFRDLASAVGRGDPREAWRAAGRMATLKLFAAALLGTGALVASFWPGVAPSTRQGLVALPAIALSSALLSQVLLHLQAEGRAHEYGRVSVLAAASDLVLCVGLTAVWGLAGLLLGSALSPVAALAWAARQRALARPRAIDRPTIRRYLGTGLPLAAIALVDQSLLSVDQLLILGLLSLRELGLYNVAFVLAEALRTLGTAAATVLGPRLLREHARAGGRLEAIRRHTLQPVLVYARALPLPTALLWIGGGFALARYYPAYAEAVRPMQVLLLASGFLVVLGGVTTFLFAIDKHPRNLFFLTPALAFNVVVDLVLLRLGWGLMAIATGSLVTYFLYAVAVLWYVSGHFDLGRRARLGFLAGATGPGVLLGLSLGLLEHLVPYRDSASATAAACALSVLICAPLAVRARQLARQLDA
jgi:O-antigen/teichoic acid export membrane protein